MGNIFNHDFKEFITALNNASVEYILVGGYSVILHGYARTTGDLDIWVNRTRENYIRLITAFNAFGLSFFDMTENNFLFNDNFDVFTFGRPPVSIDIMNKVKGLEFENCYLESTIKEVDEILIRVINYNHLIKAKMAAGRPKDIDDIEHLKE